jgi:hypothetical protein
MSTGYTRCVIIRFHVIEKKKKYRDCDDVRDSAMLLTSLKRSLSNPDDLWIATPNFVRQGGVLAMQCFYSPAFPPLPTRHHGQLELLDTPTDFENIQIYAEN